MSDDGLLAVVAKRATQVSAILVAVGLLSTMSPKVRDKIADWMGFTAVRQDINEIRDKIASIESSSALDASPTLEFVYEGNSMNNTINGWPCTSRRVCPARIGGIVVFTISYRQLRNCGRPMIAAGFRNGDDILHAFEELSIVDEAGYGFASPPNPGTVLTRRFTGRIPIDQGVSPGTARGWVEFGPYSSCPAVGVIYSERMNFEIVEGEEEGPD